MPDPVEAEVKPVVEPVVEAKPEPEVKVEAKPEVKPEAKPEPKPGAKPESDWKDKRIAELTHKLNEARRTAPPPPPAPVKAADETQAAFETRVQQEAQKRAEAIAATNAWNQQCNDVAALGAKEFPDFNDRLRACQSVVNGQDPAEVQQFNEFLHAAIETGQAHRLIHALGENPGEVKRLMAASGAKRVVELTRMADKMAVPRAADDPSAAPKPITPVGSKGIHMDGIKPDDAQHGMQLSKAEWFKRREAQVQANRERGMGMQ